MRRRTIFKNKITKRAAILLVLVIFVSTLLFVIYHPKAHAQIFLTTGTSWTVPGDWNNGNNAIETIAGGGAGGSGSASTGDGGGGGGGGAYNITKNVTLTPGSVVTFSIGSGGTVGALDAAGGNGSDTYLCNATTGCTNSGDTAVVARSKTGSGGGGSSGGGGTSGTAGASAGGTGTGFNGGAGGTGSTFSGNNGGGGGGGAGAAGPNAAGNNGSNGGISNGGAGGQGDGTFGGAGGSANTGTGSNGTEYDATHGSGGGGGGGIGVTSGTAGTGGTSGSYGAGGAGGGGSKHASGGLGSAGIQGMIRITYSYTAMTDYRWRSDDGAENAGTPLAAQDAAATIDLGTTVRLRLMVTNYNDPSTQTFRLEYAPYTTACGSWTTVPGSGATADFVMAATANYTDQVASTNVSTGSGVLTDPSGLSFTAGKLVKTTSNTATSVTMNGSTFTELEYALTTTVNTAQNSYCFRITNNGTVLNEYDHFPILKINYTPSAPTILEPAASATSVPRLPVLGLKSTDANSDNLQYVVETCSANSFPCTGPNVGVTYGTSDTCWTNQNANSGAAYTSGTTLVNSSIATCSTPIGNLLSPNTTYYMRAKSVDSRGSTSAYSSVISFTTGTLEVLINGGTTINGGTKIGN